MPGFAFAASTKSLSVLYLLSARTTSTVGSAVTSATGAKSFSSYAGGLPLMRSDTGKMEMDDRLIRSV